jgi:hypothetical protein
MNGPEFERGATLPPPLSNAPAASQIEVAFAPPLSGETFSQANHRSLVMEMSPNFPYDSPRA